MLMLPIPVFCALVLGFLALRTYLSGRQGLLVLFLAACALQTFVTVGALGFGIVNLQMILPVTGATIPALAWLTFRSVLFRSVSLAEAAPHLAAPIFCLYCRIFAPATIDVVVPLIFAGYGSAILYSLRTTEDLPLARMDAGGVPSILWSLLGWLLIASSLCDALISFAQISGNSVWADRIVSLYASATILLLGALSSLPDAAGEVDSSRIAPLASNQLSEDDRTRNDNDVISKINSLMRREKTYLDPSLTLLRLSRRLHIPEKRLSASVNRVTGGNVSRYINTWRIEHACNLMLSGQNITEAMLGSGFNTKSNFNREFLRIQHCSPREWSKSQKLLESKTSNVDSI